MQHSSLLIKLDAMRSLRPDTRYYRSRIPGSDGDALSQGNDTYFNCTIARPMSMQTYERVQLSKYAEKLEQLSIASSVSESDVSSGTVLRSHGHTNVQHSLFRSKGARKQTTCMSNEIITAVRVRPMFLSEKRSGCRRIVDMSTDDSKVDKLTCVRVTNPISLSCTEPIGSDLHTALQESNTKKKDSQVQLISAYDFDHQFWSYDQSKGKQTATQETVFDKIGSCVIDAALSGQNCFVFAHGQTSAGKTYTMGGKDQMKALSTTAMSSDSGLIPRICFELFDRMALVDAISSKPFIQLSYVEIYNERVYDLLGTRGRHKPCLKIREHPDVGVYLENMHKAPAQTFKDAMRLLDEGNRKRCVAATGSNARSSRSHAVLTVYVSMTIKTQSGESISGTNRKVQCSAITLVDLAGSERIEVSQANGERLREAVLINRSLSTLADVIHALARRTKAEQHIPYRNSALTRIIQEKLKGDSKIFMLATISPCCIHYEETIGTLNYISRAKRDAKLPQARISHNAVNMQSLRQEIMELRFKLRENNDDGAHATKDTHTRDANPALTDVDGHMDGNHRRDIPEDIDIQNRGSGDCQDMIFLDQSAIHKDDQAHPESQNTGCNTSETRVKSLMMSTLLLRRIVRKLSIVNAFNQLKISNFSYSALIDTSSANQARLQSITWESENPEQDDEEFCSADGEELKGSPQVRSNTDLELLRKCNSAHLLRKSDMSNEKSNECICGVPASNQYLNSTTNHEGVKLYNSQMQYHLPAQVSYHTWTNEWLRNSKYDAEYPPRYSPCHKSPVSRNSKDRPSLTKHDAMSGNYLINDLEPSTERGMATRLYEFKKALTSAYTHVKLLQTELSQVKRRLNDVEEEAQKDRRSHQLMQNSSTETILFLEKKLSEATCPAKVLEEGPYVVSIDEFEVEVHHRSTLELLQYKQKSDEENERQSRTETRSKLMNIENTNATKVLGETEMTSTNLSSKMVAKVSRLQPETDDMEEQLEHLKTVIKCQRAEFNRKLSLEQNRHMQTKSDLQKVNEECIRTTTESVLNILISLCHESSLFETSRQVNGRLKNIDMSIISMIENRNSQSRSFDLKSAATKLQHQHHMSCTQEKCLEHDQKSVSATVDHFAEFSIYAPHLQEPQPQQLLENKCVEAQRMLEEVKVDLKKTADRLRDELKSKNLQLKLSNEHKQTLSKWMIRLIKNLQNAGKCFLQEKMRYLQFAKRHDLEMVTNEKSYSNAIELVRLDSDRARAIQSDAESRYYQLCEQLPISELNYRDLVSNLELEIKNSDALLNKRDDEIKKAQIRIDESDAKLLNALELGTQLRTNLDRLVSSHTIKESFLKLESASQITKRLQMKQELHAEKTYRRKAERCLKKANEEIINAVAAHILDNVIRACQCIASEKDRHPRNEYDMEMQGDLLGSRVMGNLLISVKMDQAVQLDLSRKKQQPQRRESALKSDLIATADKLQERLKIAKSQILLATDNVNSLYALAARVPVVDLTHIDANNHQEEKIAMYQRAYKGPYKDLNDTDKCSTNVSTDLVKRMQDAEENLSSEKALHNETKSRLQSAISASELVMRKMNEDALIVSSRLKLQRCDAESQCMSLRSKVEHMERNKHGYKEPEIAASDRKIETLKPTNDSRRVETYFSQQGSERNNSADYHGRDERKYINGMPSAQSSHLIPHANIGLIPHKDYLSPTSQPQACDDGDALCYKTHDIFQGNHQATSSGDIFSALHYPYTAQLALSIVIEGKTVDIGQVLLHICDLQNSLRMSEEDLLANRLARMAIAMELCRMKISQNDAQVRCSRILNKKRGRNDFKECKIPTLNGIRAFQNNTVLISKSLSYQDSATEAKIGACSVPHTTCKQYSTPGHERLSKNIKPKIARTPNEVRFSSVGQKRTTVRLRETEQESNSISTSQIKARCAFIERNDIDTARIALLEEDLLQSQAISHQLRRNIYEEVVKVQLLREKLEQFEKFRLEGEARHMRQLDSSNNVMILNTLREAIIANLQSKLSAVMAQEKVHQQLGRAKSLRLQATKLDLIAKKQYIVRLKEQLQSVTGTMSDVIVNKDLETPNKSDLKIFQQKAQVDQESSDTNPDENMGFSRFCHGTVGDLGLSVGNHEAVLVDSPAFWQLELARQRELTMKIRLNESMMIVEDLRGYISRCRQIAETEQCENTAEITGRYFKRLDAWFEQNIGGDVIEISEDLMSVDTENYTSSIPTLKPENPQVESLAPTICVMKEHLMPQNLGTESSQLKSTIVYLRETLAVREEMITMLDEKIFFYENAR